MKILFYSSDACASRELDDNNTFVLEFAEGEEYDKEALKKIMIDSDDDFYPYSLEQHLERFELNGIKPKVKETSWTAMDAENDLEIDTYTWDW